MNPEQLWIVCTSCFSRPKRDCTFYLTSCSHLLCGKCVNKEQPFCKRCSTSCRIMACDSSMPPDIQEMFQNQTSKAENLIKVMTYQDGQRSGLINHLRQVEVKYSALKTYAKDLHKKYLSVAADSQKLRGQMKEAQVMIDKLTSQVQHYENKLRTRNNSGFFSPLGSQNLGLCLEDQYRRQNTCHSRSEPTGFSTLRDQRSPYGSEASCPTALTRRSNSSTHSNPQTGRRNPGGFTTPSHQTSELLSYLHNSHKRPFYAH